MTSPQDYVAVAMPARAKVPEPGTVDTEAQTGVHYQHRGPHTDMIDTGWNRQDAIEFFAMLRCSLLQIVRWIERRYPDAVK